MASITELLDKLKNARATVELVDACGKRVCSGEEHWDCPYGNEGMTNCAVLLEAAYEDTIEKLLQLAESLSAADVALAVRWIPVTERLPDPFVSVIVCRDGAPGKRIVEQGHKDVGDWWKVYGTKTKRVTHWAPLPEPPEVGC